MDDGQKCFLDLHVAAPPDGNMKLYAFPESRVATPIIGNNVHIRCQGVLNEADQLHCALIRNHGEADAPGVTPGLTLIDAADALALPDFDCAGHECHVVYATPFASYAATNPSFLGYDDLTRLAADPVLVGTHLVGAQLVEYLESSLVTRQPELALELDGRHAWRLAGIQVRSPESDRKKCMGTFHDSACREAGVAPAMTASKYRTARGNVSWFISHRAERTDEFFSPSGALKLGRACRFVGKQTLKLRKRVGERQFVSLKHFDNHKRSRLTQMLSILPLVDRCDNRTSKGYL